MTTRRMENAPMPTRMKWSACSSRCSKEGAQAAVKKEKHRESEAQMRHEAPVARAGPGPPGVAPGAEAAVDPDVKLELEQEER